MKTLITFMTSVLMALPSFGSTSDGMQEFLRVLAFNADGGHVVDHQGELHFPPTLAKQPDKFEGKVEVATINTEWDPSMWEKFSASRGFAYATPPTLIDDVPLTAKLFATEPKKLCRTLDLPRLGRLDLVAEVKPGQEGKTMVTITVVQRTQFFVASIK
ncbi:hypothetical protein JIN85_06030 [Luteolibacter pohnpeiensis]|uniref:Uncharacterized protein n=1 Tax=Luteolibacter pohnpeiensis TaxID=454153 RepID=A0A934S9S9_9BACT|nr:hypothetical protein [Luteolibacter pohnpeiensis]MBK1881964.1 hypothetical protein [Luteolibacter pohnpeiensis]